MEFKDLATKFEGLTADQVGVLAEFGKNILVYLLIYWA